MSFNSKNEKIFDLQLKRQEARVTSTDTQVYSANGGNGKFTIGETLSSCKYVYVLDDSVPGFVVYPASAISLTDTSTSITVTGLALAANDVAFVGYEVE